MPNTKKRRVSVDHPDFPHGRNTGYSAGCRDSNEFKCPTVPTCTEAHRVHHAAYMARRRAHGLQHDAGVGRVTTHVLNRLDETLTKATLEQVAEFTGLDAQHIVDWSYSSLPTRLNDEVSIELDRAWAWFCRGSDLREVTEHGVLAYYRAYCRCPVCATDQSRHKKRWANGIGPSRPLGVVKDPSIKEHLEALIEAAGTIGQVCKIARVHPEPLYRILDGKYARKITYDRLRAITPEQARAARTNQTLVDEGPTRLRVGQMRALGYPLWWINKQIGCPRNHTFPEGRKVFARIERAVEELHARVAHTAADPERDDITPVTILRTIKTAHKQGYYPAAAYNDDGTLDWQAIPDHPWARYTNRADKWLNLTRLLLNPNLTYDEVGELAASSDNQAKRAAKKLGLMFHPNGARDLDASPNAVRRAQDMLDAWDRLEVGTVTAALMLGLMDPPELRLVERGTKHPEAAMHAYARLLAEARLTEAYIARLVAKHSRSHQEAA